MSWTTRTIGCHRMKHSNRKQSVWQLCPVKMLCLLLAFSPGSLAQHLAGGHPGGFGGGRAGGFVIGGFYGDLPLTPPADSPALLRAHSTPLLE